MTAVGESDSSLAAKCLELCQTLAVQGLAFNFSLKIGSSYSFSLDARDKGVASNIANESKKRKSPSTLRRNARRKEDFLKKKQNPAPVTPEPGAEPDVGLPRGEDSFKCDICGNFFKSDNGLRIHMGKRHKHQEPPQLESMRGSSFVNTMLVSPLKDVVGEEELETVCGAITATMPSLDDMEDREDEIRFQEEIRFHQENPNTCEFCGKKCDVNVDMMEKCVGTGGTHSIPHY